MEMRDTPLPADVEYFIDCALEYAEIDAATHLTLMLYGASATLMRIIDGHDDNAQLGTRLGWRRRAAICDRLMAYADEIAHQLSPSRRGAIGYAGIRHTLHETIGMARHLANWAYEDAVTGGCLESWKTPTSESQRRRHVEFRLTPKQYRQLHGPNWIRRYVRLSRDFERLKVAARNLLGWTSTATFAALRGDIELLDAEIEEQREKVRRNMQRAIEEAVARGEFDRNREATQMFADDRVLVRIKPQYRKRIKKTRRALNRAITCATSIVGDDATRAFIAGAPVILPGKTVSLAVRKTYSCSAMGHGACQVEFRSPETGARLADACIFHESTPALDQLSAFALAMSAGEEAELIDTANLSRITDEGIANPAIAAKRKPLIPAPFEPEIPPIERRPIGVPQFRPPVEADRNAVLDGYWDATKPIWVEAVGVHVFGRSYKPVMKDRGIEL